MSKAGKATAVALLTPLTAAAIAAVCGPAEAASGCWPFASASITAPSGTITAGSTVRPKATVTGMLLKAHLQISGPGLDDQQVGDATTSGPIEGPVKVPQPGYFTLSVVGNGTGCTYTTAGFSVAPRPAAAKPRQNRTPRRSPSPAGAANAAGGSPFRLPSGTGGAAGGLGSLRPLNQNSPFSLPSVAPDGAGVQYPTPDPEVAAAPTVQPQARDVAATTPISWGRSIGVALVLLLLSAHFGMWSRRQRLAAENARGDSGPPGAGPKGSGRRARKARTAPQNRTTGTRGQASMPDLAVAVPVDEPDGTQVTTPLPGEPPRADRPTTANPDQTRADECRSPSRHGYRGRRRRL